MNWVFKVGDHFKFNEKNETTIITLYQKRNFRGREGDGVLILGKKEQEWQFTSEYKILGIVPPKEIQSEYKQFVITLGLKQDLDDKLLDDYIYSLRRVTNYSSPIKHFSRKYSRLSNTEYEAIVNDKIYKTRTIVGTILNAMHRDHQKSFILFVAEESPEQLTGKVDIDLVLELLLTYINYSVIKQAQYLVESAKILKSIINENDYAGVGFASSLDRGVKIQLIAPQESIIAEYLNQLPFSANETPETQLPDVKDDPKFKKLFKNTPLPVTLN